MSVPFVNRHIGTTQKQMENMLPVISSQSLTSLIDDTIPDDIRLTEKLDIPQAMSEQEYLQYIKEVSLKNKLVTNFIGMGYYGTITPSVILRNIFENPGWYTQYTPYQAEIAQGRLEALLNYQTLISELTALPIANASLLDEATAAAEAMTMVYSQRENKTANVLLVDENIFPQTIDVLKTRAEPLGITLQILNYKNWEVSEQVFGAIVQYPDAKGEIHDFVSITNSLHQSKAKMIVIADIMALVLKESPGNWGADVCVGSSQRFGVPMGYGGPHAAFFATTDAYKRVIPGRIIGVSVDRLGKRALRMALQTREQHIRREKATSNICTAQALLAIMASMYAVYHGIDGLHQIAVSIHNNTKRIAEGLKNASIEINNKHFFDTLCLPKNNAADLALLMQEHGVNVNERKDYITFSVDESHDETALKALCKLLSAYYNKSIDLADKKLIPIVAQHKNILQHEVFQNNRSEHQMLRYIKKLEGRDLSLCHSMIPLGSCTMKLNATTQMIPLSWSHFAQVHPFVPTNQCEGYLYIIKELSDYLCKITHFDACSLQPNSGAQGEYAGLMCIRAYHADHNQNQRNVMLIPQSAHGTNPASAVMCGMQVVVVACTPNGDIDFEDLIIKVKLHSEKLAGLMVTYPSTHGVFETEIKAICNIIHDNGGLVYMDGANMNAQVGLTSPASIGADVCHINLHKTFSIPHGGGGPGMGPICVNNKLAPYLPGHSVVKTGGEKATTAVSAAPYGSASILLISYAYIKLLGYDGIKKATEIAILNANYIKARLSSHFEVLYTGAKGMVAHELIVDFRPFKSSANIEVEDVAKRLMDYGFHAPTVSFPVAGTLMIEPTESEDQTEIDKFCEALIQIKNEIENIANGTWDKEDNPLKNAPHTQAEAAEENWTHAYSRTTALYPAPWLYENKFNPHCSRVNNAHGDRNLVCTCEPIESYM